MAFQEILDQVGSLGRFQILQMTFLLICNAIISLHLLLENFTAAIPGHRCWVPLLDGGIVYHNGSGILSQEALLRISIPMDSNLRPEKCRRFVQPQWHLLHLNGTFSNVTEPDTELCVDGWVYDQSSFPSTMVTQWDLVCDSQSLTSIAKFVFLSGMFIGNILGGYLTDRFGRKLIFICFLLQMAITETCAALVPNFSTYCLLRFLAGVSTSCTTTNIMLLMVEWTKPKFQALVMAMAFSAASLGQILLGGVAFAVRNWHHLQLATSIPIFFLLIPTRWLSESARWLIMTNQPQKCLKELRKAAKVNGVRSSGDMLTMEVVRTTMKEELEAAQKKTVSCDLFCTPILRKRICLLCLVRFATWISIYGLIIHLQYLRSNVFLLQCLFGAVAIPANFLGIFSLNHVGRRVSQLLFMSLLGIFILALIFVPEEMQTLRLVLATFGGGISFTSVTGTLVHGNELLPTIIRARALGIIGVAGSIGSSLAPLIMILTTYSASLPWIIYGVFPILGGLLVFLLPETKNQPLPDSIQDVENEGKSSRDAKPAGAFIKVTRF